MPKTEIQVSQLKFNELTKTQFNNASDLSETEIYAVDPQFTGGKLLKTDSNGDIIESTATEADALAGGTALQPNTAITGGTHTKITYDSKGLVTAGADLTSSDITTALGYTPYNSTNPNGFQANVIETVKVNGTALTPSSKSVDITVPTNNNQLTNGAGYITSSALNGYATQTWVGQQGYLTSTALNGYATEQWVGQQGYLTSITSSDVTTALGYTPYNSTNPAGYTSNVGTVTSVNNLSPVNGNVSLTIPSVDSALSTTSENPVQNKIITNALNDKQDTISDLDKYLKNSAVSSSALSILGGSVDKINVIAIGKYSAYDSSKVGANSFNLGGYSLAGEGSVSLGNGTVTKQYSIGILGGTSEPYAIQIGRGTNSTSYTMSVGLGQQDENNNYITYQLLNSSGKIPTDRLAVVTSVSSSSTNAEIPSAKLFYDTCGDIETLINAL